MAEFSLAVFIPTIVAILVAIPLAILLATGLRYYDAFMERRKQKQENDRDERDN